MILQADVAKQRDHNVVVLIEFAISLMTILDQINRESFQSFKLRIGVKKNFFRISFVKVQNYLMENFRSKSWPGDSWRDRCSKTTVRHLG